MIQAEAHGACLFCRADVVFVGDASVANCLECGAEVVRASALASRVRLDAERAERHAAEAADRARQARRRWQAIAVLAVLGGGCIALIGWYYVADAHHRVTPAIIMIVATVVLQCVALVLRSSR